MKTYYIKTFGCAANEADSERIAADYESRGYKEASSIDVADHIVINTCMVRESAENRVYGLVHNLSIEKEKGRNVKIIVTGCMVGMAVRDASGALLKRYKKTMPSVDEFLPIEEVGFDMAPLRKTKHHALVPVSNGCNNFCTYCVVPFSRGREVSRDFDEIIKECKKSIANGATKITLLGQNVNSYGADLILGKDAVTVGRDIGDTTYFSKNREKKSKKSTQYVTQDGVVLKPTYVRHLGRLRIPTLFPKLLENVASLNPSVSVSFLSSNPWDFSDDLIEVIARHNNILKEIHLPVQSGDDDMLKKMNRWYTRSEYLSLVKKLKKRVPGVLLTTDIIVGFCGETDEQFKQTVKLCKEVGFTKAYIAKYSDRPMTAAHKVYKDTVPYPVKKKRWVLLDTMINRALRKDHA